MLRSGNKRPTAQFSSKTTVCVALVLLLAISCGAGATADPGSTATSAASALSSKATSPFGEFVEAHMPSWKSLHNVASVSVVAFANSSFVALNRTFGAEADGHVVFPVGAISQMFTAWAALRLVQRGLITLDEPVGPYLNWTLPVVSPARSSDVSAVTLRALLSHVAGTSQPTYVGVQPSTTAGSDSGSGADVPDGDGVPLSTLQLLQSGYASLAPDVDPTHAACAGPVQLTARPQQALQWSDGGYVIVQRLIEQLSGLPFEAYLQAELVQPLGLRPDHTSAQWTAALQQHVASPHSVLRAPLPTRVFPARASTGVYTSASDLARFLAAAVCPTGAAQALLDPALRRQLFVPSGAAGGGDTFALGFALRTVPVPSPSSASARRNITLVGRTSGPLQGWRAAAWAAPDTGAVLAVLTNADGGAALADLLLCEWVAFLQGRPLGACPLLRGPAQLALAVLSALMVGAALLWSLITAALLLSGRRTLTCDAAPRTVAGHAGAWLPVLGLGVATLLCWVLLFGPLRPCDVGYLGAEYGALSVWPAVSLLLLFLCALLHALFVYDARVALRHRTVVLSCAALCGRRAHGDTGLSAADRGSLRINSDEDERAPLSPRGRGVAHDRPRADRGP